MLNRKRIALSLLGSLFTGCLLFVVSMAPTGCANIVPPLGGPKDSLPPALVMAKPGDSALRFEGKKITLVFDEFIQLDNVNENLIISPTPKLFPEVVAKLRTLTITIKDTLEPNTTYTYDFGNAIKDINENNVLQDFRYTFSTGPTLDNGTVTGNVLIAETGKPDSTLIAVLHRSAEDSAVRKEKPRYVARLNREGRFQFRNLPAGNFYLYVFKDEGGSRRYQSNTQLFGFADQPVTAGPTPEPVTLYAYSEKEEAKSSARTTAARVPGGGRSPVPAGANDKKLRLETNLENGELDLLKQLEFYFKAAPLKELDTTKVLFADEKFMPIRNFKLIRDTSNSKLTLQYPWVENTPYYIIVDKDFATDTAGRKLLKNDTLAFRTRKTIFYGSVKLRFLNLDLGKNPVLQFVQNGAVVLSHVFTSREFNAKLFIPGEYELRLLYDDNKNGVWDPGQFFGKRRQPEKVKPVDRKLIVKANWDNEIDITLQ